MYVRTGLYLGKEKELVARGESMIPVYIHSTRRKPFPSGKCCSFSQSVFVAHGHAPFRVVGTEQTQALPLWRRKKRADQLRVGQKGNGTGQCDRAQRGGGERMS